MSDFDLEDIRQLLPAFLGRQRRQLGDAIAHEHARAFTLLWSQTGRPTGRPATRLYHDSEL